MTHTATTTRRQFLKYSAAVSGAAAGPEIARPGAIGRGATPPGDRIAVGIVGSGERAVFETGHYPFFDNAEIVALADAQESRRASAKATLEKAYSDVRPGAAARRIRAYRDFRELLAQKDIDAVYIATPDHWHVPMLIASLRAGKHVLCEKPLGVSIGQDLAALQAVRRSGKVFQYGAERRSTPDARKGLELILNGRIGAIRKIYVVAPPSQTGGSPTPVVEPPPGFDYDMWLGPAPVKPFCADRCLRRGSANGIYAIYDYSLGFIANWAAHPLDLVQWWAENCGRKTLPVRYEGSGKLPAEGLYDVSYEWDIRCTYDDGLIVHMADHQTYKKFADAPHPELPWGRPGVTNVHNGAVFIGSEGWAILAYEKVVFSRPSIMDSVIEPGEMHLPDSTLPAIPGGMPNNHSYLASAGHHRNWIEAIRSGRKPVSSIEGAVQSDLVSQLADLCVRTGQPIRWDPGRQTIVGNEPARKMMQRPMRAPWRLS